MKNSVKTNIWKVLLSLFIAISFAGCGEMLDNPTIDKDTGEDINLLIVDFNFFTTRTSYKFIDISDHSVITKPAKMWFTGTHGNDIVNFAGKKNVLYNTSEGQMELTVDPNLDITASNPMEFAVHVEIDGYLAFSQGIQINSEGKKTIELLLTKESAGEEVTLTGEQDGDSYIFSFASENTKSAKVYSEEPSFKTTYTILSSDLKQFKTHTGQKFASIDNASITIHRYTDFPLIVDKLSLNDSGAGKMVAFRKLETGTLIKIMINGQRIVDLAEGTVNLEASFTSSPNPDIFGFAEFDETNAHWKYKGIRDSLEAFGSTYNLISASLKEISSFGCNIKFESNAISSFSIDTDIKDSNGKLIKTVNFKGNFPESFILENVTTQSATMIFRNNNLSFDSIPPLEISDLSTGSYKVDVNAAEGYEEYQIVLKATCKNNATIAVAPTYSGEFRIENSDDEWQGVDMIGGKVDLLANPNEKYELRILWEGEWETSIFGTEFDANGNYINNSSSNITSEKMDDGRTRIKVVHEFDQDICDDLDW